jgi:arsenite methyltransferase
MAGCCGSGATTARTPDEVRALVEESYSRTARRIKEGGDGCCGGEKSVITRDLYGAEEVEGVPGAALTASLGCGNPTAVADLGDGEVVLDLGSGGGIDVLISARRVGEHGKVYGLDMSEEMLALARENQREAGIRNVEFLKGRIEEIPLPAKTVDAVISNCVVNLSPEKDLVMAEVYRVLRPGGRVAISDVVFLREPSPAIRDSVALWSGCIAGALTVDEYVQALADAGFTAVEIEVTREYGSELRDLLPDAGVSAEEATGVLGAAVVRARKPGAG